VKSQDKQTLIARLGLEAHVEGGYFRRTFQADHRPMRNTPAGERYAVTAILYLLCDDSPVDHWHVNRSDILHFHHLGGAIQYTLIWPDGQLQETVLGAAAGQQFQLAVPGGVWKAARLLEGEYGLLGEAVVPGFDYADMRLGEAQELLQQFPQHRDKILALAR